MNSLVDQLREIMSEVSWNSEIQCKGGKWVGLRDRRRIGELITAVDYYPSGTCRCHPTPWRFKPWTKESDNATWFHVVRCALASYDSGVALPVDLLVEKQMRAEWNERARPGRRPLLRSLRTPRSGR